MSEAKRPFWRRVRKLLHPVLAAPLLRLSTATLPYLYVAYMWVVWKTSRIEMLGYERVLDHAAEHDGMICVLWHEEVFSVAWAYRNVPPHTLASVGDSGEMITRLLELCGYVVFRGGSSRRKSRQRETVLIEMIRHMKETPRVVYGLTVDGSNGPYHVMKPGAVVIAQKCRRPIFLVRTWAKRNVRLPTWDHMAVPLPFNHIRQYMTGPFFAPENAKDPAAFEAFRLQIENELKALAERSLVWT